MAKWTPDEIRQLALDIQLSIARLDKLQDTMKLVSELCERITGIAYPIDIEESRKTHLQELQQKTERVVATETHPKRKRGSPPERQQKP